ncbi:arf-GAP with dual PH domain-containing protein 2 isoform X2 [Corvus cornix cornix]|uniref:arf-GAP with dual PH domain-containing protein 2 isoform X2 n=1 Tax=Corvus cornix cornix TaxID=932674 RepID=UPI000901A956|nr:arf-GAP with dual PH domain-containing protein 2 isoform X2 [Corvus cornix cornix]XP_031985182.1 arf-GAP with dual PH domain-containing protein 2 isoform X2 [Corvus moneduloides]XP_041888264.1 arf-GAP with dual PH domain-containing protein 2 isoform X4 [Corvus kubaryi]
MDRDHNKALLLELQRAAGTGNDRCADCGNPDPEWASYKLGIFICLNCSGIHRNLPEISRVKSLRLDFWESNLIEFMKNHGNLWAKAKYEAKVPPYYYIPKSCDCLVLREQWIRAKYERGEFLDTQVCQDPCSAGSREGCLWKLRKGRRQFQKRQFLLSAREGVMKYFTKESKGPKAVISVESLNAMFQVDKIGHIHGLQITYTTDGQTRNLFVYHESGKEIVDWFNAIRAARYHYLRTTFPNVPEAEQKEAFKVRWFCLDSQERNLIYFKNPLDAFAQGQVFIGRRDEGYEVRDDLPERVCVKKTKPAITLVTPVREFVFLCENDRKQREWMDALNGVITQL